jgi:RNA polymerase sigma-70 factor (ECF subfamily)
VDAGDAYRQLAPAVLGYLRGQGVPEPEDLLGEVFLQVARSLPRFRGDDAEDLRRWVFTIARNRVIDDARRRARRPRTTMGIDPPDRPVTATDDRLDGEVLEALGRLTPEQREVVTLRFIADLSVEEVARITRRTSGAVKSMQARGLAQLARALEDPSDAV